MSLPVNTNRRTGAGVSALHSHFPLTFKNETPSTLSDRYKTTNATTLTTAAPHSNGYPSLKFIHTDTYMCCEKCKNSNMADWCLDCKFCEDCCPGYGEGSHS